MLIYITVGVSPYLLSIEDKSVLLEGQTEFQTTQTSPFVTGYDASCTKIVYDAIVDKVGTIEAPAFHANKIIAETAPYEGRQNCYIENGSLKLV